MMANLLSSVIESLTLSHKINPTLVLHPPGIYGYRDTRKIC